MKIASEGQKIKFQHRHTKVELVGIVTVVKENTVVVDISGSPYFSGNVNEIYQLVRHEKYEIVSDKVATNYQSSVRTLSKEEVAALSAEKQLINTVAGVRAVLDYETYQTLSQSKTGKQIAADYSIDYKAFMNWVKSERIKREKDGGLVKAQVVNKVTEPVTEQELESKLQLLKGNDVYADSNSTKEVEILRKENSELRNNLMGVKADYETLQKERDQLHERIGALLVENKAIQDDLQTATEIVKKQEKSIRNMLDEREAILKEKTDLISELKRDIESLTAQRDDLRKRACETDKPSSEELLTLLERERIQAENKLAELSTVESYLKRVKEQA